jgi:hypothetical protein
LVSEPVMKEKGVAIGLENKIRWKIIFPERGKRVFEVGQEKMG